MSNGDTTVDVTSEGTYHLGLAIDLALIYHTGGKFKTEMTHWGVFDNKLVFAWHEGEGLTALPAPCDRDMLIPIIYAWLKKQDYGREPDTDGSTSKGWRLRSGEGKMPDAKDFFYMRFSITPTWLEYSK